MQIYIFHDGQQLGPFTEAEVRSQLATGTISLEDMAWWEGQADWVPLSQSPLGAAAAAEIKAAAPEIKPASPVTLAPASSAPVVETAGAVPPGKGTTSGVAIGSLVTGILGLVCCISSIVAVVLGHLGLAEIKRNPSLQGKGMAQAGLILGYAILGLSLVLGIIYCCVPADRAMFKQPMEQLPGGLGH